jgi:hypothetical protein
MTRSAAQVRRIRGWGSRRQIDVSTGLAHCSPLNTLISSSHREDTVDYEHSDISSIDALGIRVTNYSRILVRDARLLMIWFHAP